MIRRAGAGDCGCSRSASCDEHAPRVMFDAAPGGASVLAGRRRRVLVTAFRARGQAAQIPRCTAGLASQARSVVLRVRLCVCPRLKPGVRCVTLSSDQPSRKCVRISLVRPQFAVRRRQSPYLGLRTLFAREGTVLPVPRTPGLLGPGVVALVLLVPPVGLVVLWWRWWSQRYRATLRTSQQAVGAPSQARSAGRPQRSVVCGEPKISTSPARRDGCSGSPPPRQRARFEQS